MNLIIQALGLPQLGHTQEAEIVKKVLADNLVGIRVQELIVRQYAVEVVKAMPPIERAALVKRIGLDKPQKSRVLWNVGLGQQTGQAFISFEGGNQTSYFKGTPDAARAVKFLGESCPQHILDYYREIYKPMGFSQDEELAKHRKDLHHVDLPPDPNRIQPARGEG